MSVDVVGAFCDAVGLNASMCDFLRTAFDMLGINLNDLEGQLKEKGKARLCDELVEAIGADFPGGETKVRQLCNNILGKIESALYGIVEPSSPKPPSGVRLKAVAATATTALVDDTVHGTSKVVYRCRDGKTVCVAEWPGGSRVLSDRECKHLTRPTCPPALPVGTIATPADDGMFRVAIPRPPTSSATADYIEVAARGDIPPDVLEVMLRDFLRKTGQLPLYKDPIFWGIALGSATVLGGAIWIRVRRSRG
ncbi:MAG: hypothetical protein JSV86_10675 [Gemmatimonadota bacterium]|nr:MAG: hypothetical protein JSV86_10675 [Gemmatimonadota bacterium]